MTTSEQAMRLELSTIQPIALDQRHGRARDLFTVWFGSNIMLLTITTGALAVSVFGLPFGWAVASLIAGNLIGAVFMALHAAQGPTVGLVIVMYVGFFASNLVVGGQSLAAVIPWMNEATGIVLLGLLSVAGAIFGYDLIHAYTRVMTYFSGAVLALTFIWVVFVHGLPAQLAPGRVPTIAGVLGGISIAALWQISYAPYVSDYSRYMPAGTGARPAFWASYWGCSLGSILPMLLGALVAASGAAGSVVAGLRALTDGFAPVVFIVFTVGIIASNAMNLYCGSLSTLTFGQTLVASWSPKAGARSLVAVILLGFALSLALLGRASFMVNYTDFILLLLYVLVPWTAINLVDYYLIQHASYDVPSFLRADGGIYGRVNIAAVVCYVFGTLIQLPFVASELYTGPVARAMHGADLSWIVGLVVTAPIYYVAARMSGVRTASGVISSARSAAIRPVTPASRNVST
jgi:NCS1 family nucleobase:cation symporter-1